MLIRTCSVKSVLPHREHGCTGIQDNRPPEIVLSVLSIHVSQGSTHGRRLNQTPHRSVGHSGRPRRGRSIEKDQKLNMDAQDAQDKQDEGLLRGELTPAMIRCGRAQFSKRDPPGSAGVPPAPSLAQPRPSPPLGSTGNGAMALLRTGQCRSRRQGGCLQHCTEAQRQPKGQHAGGTPALPGKARSRRKGGCLRHCTEAQRQPKGQHAGGTPALPGKAACGIALKLSPCQRDACKGDARCWQGGPAERVACLH